MTMKKLSLVLLLIILFVTPALTSRATAPITGFPIACVGTQTTLHDATGGGLWSSTNPSVATVGLTSGIVTGVSVGTATISYNVSGIASVIVVTINPAPFAGSVSGPSQVCAGQHISLTDPVPGGTWSSGAPIVASVDGSGNVMGISGGTVAISYTVSNSSCSVAAIEIVTVHALPPAGAISGPSVVCSGNSITLSDAAIGGVWSTAAASVATVSPTGIVTGIATGTTKISYTITSVFGCVASATHMVRVNPSAITGYTTICVSNVTQLSDSAAGGTWSSSNTSIANINPATGLANGLTAGSVTITYSLPAGCFVTIPLLVQPALSPILGAVAICNTATSSLSDASAGGVWSSGDASIATIDFATGMVTGIASGVTFITYSLNPGCIATTAVTINQIPLAFDVTGGGSYCAGGAGVPIGLDGSDNSIRYQLFYGASAIDTLYGTGTILNYGLFTSAGVYTVLATDLITGCSNYMNGSATVVISSITAPAVTVTASTGLSICDGVTVLYTASPVSGGLSPAYQWSVNNSPAGSGASTFTYTPADQDTITVILKSSAECVSPDSAVASVIMTVHPVLEPSSVITASPGDSVCPGTSVSFSVSPINGGTSPTFHWKVNGIFSGSGPTYSFVPVDGDHVYCEMLSSYVCPSIDSSPSNSINMRVPPLFVPDVVVLANPGTYIGTGERVMFTAEVVTLGGIIEGYQWQINSNPIPGATSDTFSSNTLQNHDTVRCLVTGSVPCGIAVGSDQVVITDSVAQAGLAGVQAFTDISLLPNPNKGTFIVKGTLSSPADEILEITVTDMLGQSVFRDALQTRGGKLSAEIQLNGTLATGLYLMDLKGRTGHTKFRFVVE